MLTLDQKKTIKKLKQLSQSAKKGPWYPFGVPNKDGTRIYKLKPPEEDLIILMRNSVDELVSIIEELAK